MARVLLQYALVAERNLGQMAGQFLVGIRLACLHRHTGWESPRAACTRQKERARPWANRPPANRPPLDARPVAAGAQSEYARNVRFVVGNFPLFGGFGFGTVPERLSSPKFSVECH